MPRTPRTSTWAPGAALHSPHFTVCYNCLTRNRAIRRARGENMKSAILANAALCVCPPLIATAAVVAHPAARHAVHKLTAPHHHHAQKEHGRRSPCPAVKRATAAAGLPTDGDVLATISSPEGEVLPTATSASIANDGAPLAIDTGYGSGIFPRGPGPFGGTAPTRPTSPVGPVTQPGAVPEPTSWAMMIVGFLGVGVLCRRRAQSRGRGALLGRVAAAVEVLSSPALGLGQTAAVGANASSSLGAAIAATVAKKAAVCVCSGAILATAVATVPPLKRAVYAATMPAPTLAVDNCRPRG